MNEFLIAQMKKKNDKIKSIDSVSEAKLLILYINVSKNKQGLWLRLSHNSNAICSPDF